MLRFSNQKSLVKTLPRYVLKGALYDFRNCWYHSELCFQLRFWVA